MKKLLLSRIGLHVLFAICICPWNRLSAQNTGDLLANNVRYIPVSQLTAAASVPPVASEKIKLDYVTDFENIYSQNEIQFLKSLVMEYEKRTSIQINIITFDPSMINNDDSSGIGRFPDQTIDNPDSDSDVVLIKICVDRRLMQIEDFKKTRHRITVRQSKRIINSGFVPFFQKREFFEGSLKGLNELMKQLESNGASKD